MMKKPDYSVELKYRRKGSCFFHFSFYICFIYFIVVQIIRHNLPRKNLYDLMNNHLLKNGTDDVTVIAMIIFIKRAVNHFVNIKISNARSYNTKFVFLCNILKL